MRRIATILSRSHFPPYGAAAGLTVAVAVWQFLMLERRDGDAKASGRNP